MRRLVVLALLALCGAAHASSVEVGFSPEGSARQLVLDTIDNAHSNIHMMAYEFQAKDIVNALENAAHRGVSVQVVVDNKENMHNKRALENIADAKSAGVQLRVDSNYHIQHDKVIIADNDTVATGSFNYSKSAEHANSENVIVIHHMSDVTNKYQRHFNDRWSKSNEL